MMSDASLLNLKNPELKITKFLDLDKYNKKIYNNFFLQDYKIVVKIPLEIKEKFSRELKIETFNLENHTYLLSYE